MDEKGRFSASSPMKTGQMADTNAGQTVKTVENRTD